MSVPKRTDRKWRISSYSGNNSQCVEVALAEAVIGVRDSKARTSGELTVVAPSWTALLEQIR